MVRYSYTKGKRKIIMTETVTKAIKEFKEQVEKTYVVNGAVPLENFWKYAQSISAIEIIEDVNENYLDDEDDENYLVLDNLVKEYGSLEQLADEIIDDDYIIPDWNSVTDFHEYAEDVISTAKELLN